MGLLLISAAVIRERRRDGQSHVTARRLPLFSQQLQHL